MPVTVDDEIAQRRRNVRAVELLSASCRAHHRGLRRASLRLANAAWEIAPETCAAVIGGMQIGEVPRPQEDPAGWASYVQAQRDGLARAVSEELKYRENAEACDCGERLGDCGHEDDYTYETFRQL